MRSMRSVQRQVELRRLGNQLPVLCKVVKMLCVLPLRLSSVHVVPGITISRIIVARAKSVSRLDDVQKYQLCPLAV